MTADRRDKKSDAEWKEILTPEQFFVCRQAGTERPFTGEYLFCEKEGVYHCVCCDTPLFSSRDKFNSSCGWPSFTRSLGAQAVRYEEDRKLSTIRTEVLCKSCDAHLGHVFDDGPPPTGKRYCINSVALRLRSEEASD